MSTALRRRLAGDFKTLRKTVAERDNNECQTCGVKVDWNNRRGTGNAGRLEHIDRDVFGDASAYRVICGRCAQQKAGA